MAGGDGQRAVVEAGTVVMDGDEWVVGALGDRECGSGRSWQWMQGWTEAMALMMLVILCDGALGSESRGKDELLQGMGAVGTTAYVAVERGETALCTSVTRENKMGWVVYGVRLSV